MYQEIGLLITDLETWSVAFEPNIRVNMFTRVALPAAAIVFCHVSNFTSKSKGG